MSANLLWIFVKIVLPLMPIVINFIFIKIMGSDKKWYQILTGGELFIFSTTISASAIGVISCSVKYLHSGGRKALMLKAEGRREERVKRDKVFL
ncbi:MAG: hypothetical protein F6K39_22815 [Okeania sp. SIO3B3]|nr:hypothetical protein [Okeania sp. SIO3B3]